MFSKYGKRIGHLKSLCDPSISTLNHQSSIRTVMLYCICTVSMIPVLSGFLFVLFVHTVRPGLTCSFTKTNNNKNQRISRLISMVASTIAITAMEMQLTTIGIQEKDAVRALLGISPETASEMIPYHGYGEQLNQTEANDVNLNAEHSIISKAEFPLTTPHGFTVDETQDLYYSTPRDSGTSTIQGNGSPSGLETLAALAEREQNASKNRLLPSFLLPGGNHYSDVSSSTSSQSESIESMPPPAPRPRIGRLRSVSNPEGMEKWDPLHSNQHHSCRRHFVLPASILEEELAEANEAVRQRSRSPMPETSVPDQTEYYDVGEPTNTNNTNDCSALEEIHSDVGEELAKQNALSPNELLRRARTQLLDDLSSETAIVNGEKGVVTLPHTLTKYKEVYNKHGRIGIYTPSERAAIIARFNDKRSRRNWNKKIRYNCRKSLADRRLRVKGRFVKRSEQDELAKKKNDDDQDEPHIIRNYNQDRGQKRVTICDEVDFRDDNGVVEDEEDDEVLTTDQDEDMPDTNDPDAGFSPTEDQPYRRLRRHTIT